MVFGKHKKELEKLRAENKLFKENLPKIHEFIKLIQDMNALGVGIMEFRRLNPDNILMVRP